MQSIKESLKANWIKLLMIVVVSVFLYNIIDDVRHYLRKDTVTQIPTTQHVPIYITPQGQVSSEKPPVYVTFAPTYTEKDTVAIKEKPNPKTDPDVAISDKTVYRFSYNGKPFEYQPDFKENYKFEKGQLVVQREAQSTINVSVPTPVAGIGIGSNFEGRPTVIGTYRIAGSTNIWAVTDGSKRGSSAGIMFFKYK